MAEKLFYHIGCNVTHHVANTKCSLDFSENLDNVLAVFWELPAPFSFLRDAVTAITSREIGNNAVYFTAPPGGRE